MVKERDIYKPFKNQLTSLEEIRVYLLDNKEKMAKYFKNQKYPKTTVFPNLLKIKQKLLNDDLFKNIFNKQKKNRNSTKKSYFDKIVEKNKFE